jgi:branched-chain amino acid transport system substrate-binding protein
MSKVGWRKGALVAVVLAMVVAVAAITVGSSVAAPSAAGPIKIGTSLSLSGDFSDPGKAVKRGYLLWAAYVNAHGGILGRKVQLKIVDDASSPDQVVTNYRNLITRDKVDLVFGPFSSLLTGPAATVANRYHYAMLGPAGGGPKVFALKLPNYFFVQPAPVVRCGDSFVDYVSSLPASKRPKTAAYASLDDPFASPIADRMQAKFQAKGVKTVYKTIYPSETTDLTPIVEKAIAKNPDMIVAGTQSQDAYSQVKALIQAGYNPKFLFFANGANSPTEFPDKVGRANTTGIFSCGDWFPNSNAPGNTQFIKAYLKKYGGTAYGIDSGSAEAYAVGQIIEAEAKKTGSIDNKTIIKTLHSGKWPTVEGYLSWDKYGSPQGSDLLVEWIGGKLLPVYPASVALHKPVVPKPNWKG